LNPVICTSVDPTDDPIIQIAIENRIPYFRGDLLNKIARWSDCAESRGDDYIHLLDCDDPYFDNDEIKLSVSRLINNSFDIVHTSDKSDGGFASCGTSVTSKYLSALRERVERLNSNDLDVVPWNLLSSVYDKVSKMPDNNLIASEINLRITLDYIEDYELIKAIYKKVGTTCSRIEVENYLIENKSLINLNNFRTQDFQNNKKSQLINNFGVRNA
jgi:spore coat polysaccharide biosynthesis protein SpsF (cytidylyltransferase family)